MISQSTKRRRRRRRYNFDLNEFEGNKFFSLNSFHLILLNCFYFNDLLIIVQYLDLLYVYV